jgi:hypothetical protein
MKNRYEYLPGLFGLGFIAAGCTVKSTYMRSKNTLLVCDGASEITTEAQPERIKRKRSRSECKRKGSSSEP